MNNPDPLNPISTLAEHLDELGEHQAAIVVRDVLSSLRSCCDPIPDTATLVQFVAGMVHETSARLNDVREKASKLITAERCWDAAKNGGSAVAELVDLALVMAVRSTVPHMHVNRAWPTVGETVMTTAVVAEVGRMTIAELKTNTGTVRQLDTRRRRVRVQWPTHSRWMDVGDVVGFRSWRTRADER